MLNTVYHWCIKHKHFCITAIALSALLNNVIAGDLISYLGLLYIQRRQRLDHELIEAFRSQYGKEEIQSMDRT